MHSTPEERSSDSAICGGKWPISTTIANIKNIFDAETNTCEATKGCRHSSLRLLLLEQQKRRCLPCDHAYLPDPVVLVLVAGAGPQFERDSRAEQRQQCITRHRCSCCLLALSFFVSAAVLCNAAVQWGICSFRPCRPTVPVRSARSKEQNRRKDGATSTWGYIGVCSAVPPTHAV